MDKTEVVKRSQMPAPGEVAVRTWKLPRGFARTHDRLERAIKDGATVKGLLGPGASVGHRIRKNQPVRRASLKAVEKALDAWESKKPIRLRAAKRAMRPRRPATKAAGTVVATPFTGLGALVETYLALTPDDRVKAISILVVIGTGKHSE